jgi:hypothetical protein
MLATEKEEKFNFRCIKKKNHVTKICALGTLLHRSRPKQSDGKWFQTFFSAPHLQE